MPGIKRSSSWICKAVDFCLAMFCLLITSASLASSARLSSQQDSRFERQVLALEIPLPDHSRPQTPLIRVSVSPGVRGMRLIHRPQLTINDAKAAGDLTAVDIWADGEDHAIRVRLSIIYNDLSNSEWWKDKKEKILGSYFIPQGGTVFPSELAQYGIEPFEMRTIDARPVILQAGEGPRITNKTKSLEVVRLEKDFEGRYLLWIRNNSPDNVFAYAITSGMSDRSFSTVGFGIAPRDLFNMPVSDRATDTNGITIAVVVFEDGSFEGDANLAARHSARVEGIRIQSPKVLHLIEEALESEDAGLPTAFKKLEAQLWAIPEAIDKDSALELLRSRFTSFDKKTLNSLYEQLKGGLYDARNMALSPIGETTRRIEANQRQNTVKSTQLAEIIRGALIDMKERFEGIASRPRWR